MSFEIQINQNILAGYPGEIPGISLGYPAKMPEKFEKKSLCSILVPYILAQDDMPKRPMRAATRG